MLPVLFTLHVPAAVVPALVALAVVIVALARAWSFRRQSARAGERVSWGAALWDDKLALAALAFAAALAWRGGLLAGPLLLPLQTYGILVAAGFLAGILLAQREARRAGQDAERIGELAFWVLVSALAGSRLYFIAVNWRDYTGAHAWTKLGGLPLPRVLALWEGGLVFYGGFIAAALTGVVYLRRWHLPILPYADTVIPSVALGHFFGRLGCFAAGCCWGEACPAGLPWSVRFPPGSLAYETLAERPGASLLALGHATTLPLHPTQLYEAFGELGLFLVLVLVVRPRKRFDGQVLATWLAAYALLRATVEVFRGDVERGVVAGLGVGQWTSIAILGAAALVWAAGRRGGLAGRADGGLPRAT